MGSTSPMGAHEKLEKHKVACCFNFYHLKSLSSVFKRHNIEKGVGNPTALHLTDSGYARGY